MEFESNFLRLFYSGDEKKQFFLLTESFFTMFFSFLNYVLISLNNLGKTTAVNNLLLIILLSSVFFPFTLRAGIIERFE